MASILILSRNGDGVPLAYKLANENHIVKVYTEREDIELTKGNPSKINSPTKLLEQFDLVISSDPGLGELADSIKSQGKKVIGGGIFSDKLFFEPEYNKRVVNQTVGLSSEPLPEGGLEVDVEGWFDGNSFIHPFTHTFSYHRICEGDKGPPIGRAGHVVRQVDNSELANRGLIPLTDLLQKVNYSGPVSGNMWVYEDRAYCSYIRAGFQFNSIFAFSEIVRRGLFNLFWSLTEETLGERGVMFLPGWAISVGVFDLTPDGKKEVFEVPTPAKHHVHLSYVYPLVGCVTARGENIRECQRRASRTLKNVILHPDLQYRNDIGKDAELRMEALKQWGWIDAISEVESSADDSGDRISVQEEDLRPST